MREMAAKKATPRKPSDKALEHVAVALRKFPERLRGECKERGWTMARLAEESGVSASVLSRQPEGMSWWGVLALAKALGVRVGWLMGVEQQKRDEGKRPSVRLAPDFETADEIASPSAEQPRAHEPSRPRKSR